MPAATRVYKPSARSSFWARVNARRSSQRRPAMVATPLGGEAVAMTASDQRVIKRARLQQKSDRNMSRSTVLATAQTNSATITCINAIGQGDTSADRQGDRIVMEKLQLRWHVSAQDAVNTFRIIVFVDKQINGTAPTAAEFFEANGTDPTVEEVKFQRQQRFKVLYDKSVYLTLAGYDNQGDVAEFSVTPSVTTFGATTAAVGSVLTNGLFVLTVSDSALSGPSYSWNTNLYYSE